MLLRLLLSSILIVSALSASKKYCTSETEKQRTTSIYLDLGNTDDKRFATNLLSQLSGNFLPHERVQVFTINPVDVNIKQIYNSCVPKLTHAEITKIKKEGSLKYMLGGNPIDAANEDMTFFMAEIKSTLVKAYKNNVSESIEKKELIEMLYSESGVFEAKAMQRVIIYSDMIQNSEEIKTSNLFDSKVQKKYMKEYKVDFNLAEFYIYNGKKKFGVSKHNKLIKFWKDYFELNNGHVTFFNDNLKLVKVKNLRRKIYEGQLEINDKEYESKFFVNYSSNGKTSNSWFVINEIEAIPLKGKVKLVRGKPSLINLKVANINKENHNLFVGDEKFTFKVKGKRLSGSIKIDNAEIILNGNTIKDPTFKIKMSETNG